MTGFGTSLQHSLNQLGAEFKPVFLCNKQRQISILFGLVVIIVWFVWVLLGFFVCVCVHFSGFLFKIAQRNQLFGKLYSI